jgi:hypothetical protein
LGGLFAYDLLIGWKGARAAFSRKRDLLLLLLAVPIFALVAAQGAANAVAVVRDLDLPARMLLLAVAGFVVNLAAERRIAHLAAESIVARLALRGGPRLVHRLFWNLLPFAALFSLAAPASGSQAIALRAAALALAYAVGAGAAALARRARLHLARRSNRRRAASGEARSIALTGRDRAKRIAALVAARTGVAGPSVAASALAFGIVGACIALAYRITAGTLPRPGAELLAAAAAAFAFGLLLRQHPPLPRYLLYLGIGPVGPALVPAASACSLAAGLAVGAAALGLPDALALAALAAAAVLLFLVLALLRAYHYAIRPRQAAELAMQIDAVAILLAGFVTPPAALLLLAGRFVMLHRRARSLRFAAT